MKHSFPAAAMAVILVLSTSLAATAADTDPAAVQPGTYAVDPQHTRVLFSVNHLGFNDYFGQFSEITGKLKMDPKNLGESKIDISVPVSKVSTTNAKLDDELRSADWFDAAKFPVIRFVSTQITRTGDKTARITGNLSMHGVTKPMVLDATFVGAGVNPLSKAYTAGFSAIGQVKRSEFGVNKYVPLVGDDVALTISAAFEK